MNKTAKIGLVLGTVGLGLVILAKRATGGGNGGNGGGNGGVFTFGQPTVEIAGAFGGWGLLGFDCDVTNNSGETTTRVLEVWYTQTVDYSQVPGFEYLGIVTTDPKPIYLPGHSALSISLQPGEGDTYHYSGLDYDPGAEGVFLLSGEMQYDFWLQDDLGNKSNSVALQT